MHVGLTEPDECIMLFIQQMLQRAKEDGLCLGIYDDINNSKQHDDITVSAFSLKMPAILMLDCV
jgi:hypothetical protein